MPNAFEREPEVMSFAQLLEKYEMLCVDSGSIQDAWEHDPRRMEENLLEMSVGRIRPYQLWLPLGNHSPEDRDRAVRKAWDEWQYRVYRAKRLYKHLYHINRLRTSMDEGLLREIEGHYDRRLHDRNYFLLVRS